MRAVHLHTQGVSDVHEAALVEMLVRLTDGVSDVASVRSLDLMSVLYDEKATELTAILQAVRSAGFDARAIESPRALSRAS